MNRNIGKFQIPKISTHTKKAKYLNRNSKNFLSNVVTVLTVGIKWKYMKKKMSYRALITVKVNESTKIWRHLAKDIFEAEVEELVELDGQGVRTVKIVIQIFLCHDFWM